MAEPLEINISKSFVDYGGKQWATYENGGGVTVQVWKDQQLKLQRDLSYADYAVFREQASAIKLRDYPDPALNRKGGTNANGNTLGRVVGETASAEVPASEANPPIKAETEAEQSWWESANPWVHGGLDVLGFVPGLGAIPDLINAGIYAAEGDPVNAALSAAAAVPLAGDALKGGVLVGTGVSKVGGRAGKEIAEEAASKKSVEKTRRVTEKKKNDYKPSESDVQKKEGKDGGSIKGKGRLDVECFTLPEGADENEFLRQLKEQEDALNSMDASTLIDRRKAIDDAGGTGPIRDKKAQRIARKNYKKKRINELRTQEISASQAKKIVSAELDDLAATHVLDIIAGGNPSDVTIGDKRINSSVGAQWKGRRSQSLEDHAKEMERKGSGKDKMNVKLKKCPGLKK